MKRLTQCSLVLFLALTILALPAVPARAGDTSLTGEFTPTAWLAGIHLGINGGGRTTNADIGFSDLVKQIKTGFSFLSAVDYKHYVGYLQSDWVSARWDKTGNVVGNSSLRVNFTDTTLAGGYRVDSFYPGAHVDLMAGIQYTYLGATYSSSFPDLVYDKNLVDGVFVMRPVFPFYKKWAFSPTWQVGAGYSDLTYQLSPQLSYQFTENWIGRVGYRKLYYKTHNDYVDSQGYLYGVLFGVGYTFGGSATKVASVPSPETQALAPLTVAMALNPARVSASAQQIQQFQVQVTGTDNSTVNWSINPPLGSISNSGQYTAPDTIALPETVTVTATSVADPTKTATSQIKLVPPAAAPKEVDIQMNILFDTNQTAIKPRYDGEIQKVAKFMKTYPDCHADIDGYTDNVGKASYNLALSQRRAESVRTYMNQKFGIALNRLTAKGYGETNPIASNKTTAGRAQNRRVVAALTAQEQPNAQ